MSTDLFRTLIVAAPVAEQVRQLAAAWPGGAGMFQTALTDGTETTVTETIEGIDGPEIVEQVVLAITHYISTGYIDPAIATALPWTEYSVDSEGNTITTDNPGDIPALVDWINEEAQAGVTVEQVQALLPYADVSTQDPHDAMARLGLSLHATPDP